jgi:hypothetical protein
MDPRWRRHYWHRARCPEAAIGNRASQLEVSGALLAPAPGTGSRVSLARCAPSAPRIDGAEGIGIF